MRQVELFTYHHADDWDQEDDLNQAVEDEKDAAEHLVGCLKTKFDGIRNATRRRLSNGPVRVEVCDLSRWRPEVDARPLYSGSV